MERKLSDSARDSYPTVTVRDENGKILTQWEADPKNYCQGASTGSINELCGGCGFCMEMQANYYGLTVEYDGSTEETFETQKERPRTKEQKATPFWNL